MARGRKMNCRLCMKPKNRDELTTMDHLPKTFAYILEEMSGIKFSEADGLKIKLCVRCKEFLQAIENHSEHPKANKISGAGKRKIRILMDKGVPASEAIARVIAEKRARDLLSGTGLNAQQNIPDKKMPRMNKEQRVNYNGLVGAGMNTANALELVLAATGALAAAAQPQQRNPALLRGIQKNVLPRGIGPRNVAKKGPVQAAGGRVQQNAAGKVVGPKQRPQNAGAAPNAPLQKGPPQKNRNGPVAGKPVPNRPVKNAQPNQPKAIAVQGNQQNYVKRPRQNNRNAPYETNRGNPVNQNNQRNQNQNRQGNGNYNQQDCPLEDGIVPLNFPNVQLDEAKLEALKEAITNEIFKIPPGGPQIRFLGTTFENGWLRVICADQITHNWLKSLVSRWERAGVRLVEGNALPQPVVLTLYLTGDFRSPDEILGILDRQNTQLNTNKWRIINREIDTNGQSITVCVDEQSFRALQSRDFMVYLGVGLVEFKPRRFPSDGGTFSNSNMRGQSANNNSNYNNNNANNNPMGFPNGGNFNKKSGGGGGVGGGKNGMGNNYQSKQNRSNNVVGGSYNKRQGVSQGQGFQRPRYQNQRSW